MYMYICIYTYQHTWGWGGRGLVGKAEGRRGVARPVNCFTVTTFLAFDTLNPAPYNPRPTPYNRHPTPYTLKEGGEGGGDL